LKKIPFISFCWKIFGKCASDIIRDDSAKVKTDLDRSNGRKIRADRHRQGDWIKVMEWKVIVGSLCSLSAPSSLVIQCISIPASCNTRQPVTVRTSGDYSLEPADKMVLSFFVLHFYFYTAQSDDMKGEKGDQFALSFFFTNSTSGTKVLPCRKFLIDNNTHKSRNVCALQLFSFF
jgi:hypothetical protein